MPNKYIKSPCSVFRVRSKNLGLRHDQDVCIRSPKIRFHELGREWSTRLSRQRVQNVQRLEIVNAGGCSGGSQWFRVALALGNRKVQVVNSMDIWENSGNKSADGNNPTAHTELW